MLTRVGGVTKSNFSSPVVQKPFVRNYAVPAREISGLNTNAKPGECPTVITGKAGAYAMMFFENAYADGGDTGVKLFEKELNLLAWTVRKDKQRWLAETSSPLLNAEARAALVAERCRGLGLSKFFTNCVVRLVKDDIIGKLNQLRVDYEEIMRAFRREVDVVLVTKEKMSDAELSFLKKNIQLSFLKPNDNMIFRHEIDSSITKGYKITVSGVNYDYTWNKSQAEVQDRIRAEIKAKDTRSASILSSNVSLLPTKQIVESFVKRFGEFVPADSWSKLESNVVDSDPAAELLQILNQK